MKEQISAHPFTKKYKEYLEIKRQVNLNEHDNVQFKAIREETAYNGASTTYFIRKYINNKAESIDFEINENKKLDLYVALNKMIPTRKELYINKLKQLKCIRVEETLRCVFRKEIYDNSNGEFLNYDFATVNVPTDQQKKHVKYRFTNESSIEAQLQNSIEYFINGILMVDLGN